MIATILQRAERHAANEIFPGIPNPIEIPIEKPLQLCEVQLAARKFCGMIGFDEAATFKTIVAVMELGNRFFVETRKSGKMSLSAVRLAGGLGLEVTAQRRDPGPPQGIVVLFEPDATHSPAAPGN